MTVFGDRVFPGATSEEIKTRTQREGRVKTGEKAAIVKLRRWVWGEASHAVLFMTPAVLLFTLCTMFAEPRAGQVQAKRLGEDAESGKICSHVYSLLAGPAAVAVAIMLSSLLSWPPQQTQLWRTVRGHFLGGAHTGHRLWPIRYLLTRMCSAINDLGCYGVIVYKMWGEQHTRPLIHH